MKAITATMGRKYVFLLLLWNIIISIISFNKIGVQFVCCSAENYLPYSRTFSKGHFHEAMLRLEALKDSINKPPSPSPSTFSPPSSYFLSPSPSSLPSMVLLH